MENESNEMSSVLETLDVVVKKFGAFVIQVCIDIKIPQESIDSLKFVFERDALVLYPKIKDFLSKNGELITARDQQALRNLLPKEFRDIQLDQKIIDRGFVFGDAFLAIKEDLDNL